MFIPIQCLELYMGILWGDRLHVSINPPTWTRTHARVGFWADTSQGSQILNTMDLLVMGKKSMTQAH